MKRRKKSSRSCLIPTPRLVPPEPRWPWTEAISRRSRLWSRRGPGDCPSLARLRGQLALLRHDAAGAVRDYKTALAADPLDRSTLAGLGTALKMTGDDKAAEPYLEVARRHDALWGLIARAATAEGERDPRLPFQMGVGCAAVGRIPEARAWLRLAIKNDPADTQAQEELFKVEHQDGPALPVTRFGKEQVNHEPPMYRHRFVFSIMATALAAILAALAWWIVGEWRIRVGLEWADQQIDLGRYQAARDRLAWLSTCWPGHGELEYRLGLCEERLGDAAGALAAWTRVPWESPLFDQAGVERGRLLIRRYGRFSEAEDLLRSLLRRNHPPPARTRWLLAELLLWEGRLGEVRHLLQEGFRRMRGRDRPAASASLAARLGCRRPRGGRRDSPACQPVRGG